MHPLHDIDTTAFRDFNVPFLIQALAPLSICEIQCFDAQGIELAHVLKSVMGLLYPQPWQAFIAGTRAVIRPDSEAFVLVTTEGETESALHRRLCLGLKSNAGAVLDVSYGLCGVRFEGYASAQALSAGCQQNLETFDVGQVHRVRFDNVSAIVHRRDFDRWDLYLPRSQTVSFCLWLIRLCRNDGVRLVA